MEVMLGTHSSLLARQLSLPLLLNFIQRPIGCFYSKCLAAARCYLRFYAAPCEPHWTIGGFFPTQQKTRGLFAQVWTGGSTVKPGEIPTTWNQCLAIWFCII